MLNEQIILVTKTITKFSIATNGNNIKKAGNNKREKKISWKKNNQTKHNDRSYNK